MKLMIRNLLYLFKRFKTAVVLNLFGLTIAFAAFLLIVMQVDYEMNYDAMHSKSGRTFRPSLPHLPGSSKLHLRTGRIHAGAVQLCCLSPPQSFHLPATFFPPDTSTVPSPPAGQNAP